MHVFLTGASGYVGHALLTRLAADGHRVTALARSDTAADRIALAGGEVRRGDLGDSNVLRAAAADADVVVHTAIDYTDPGMGDLDAAALDALLGHGAFVYTSTTLVYGDTGDRPATEDAPVANKALQPYKVDGERRVLATGGVVLRAALVYGRGGSTMINGLLASARATGASTYIGDGANAWSTVHVDDLVDLYLRVLAQPPAPQVLNAAGDAVTMAAIAAAVGRATGTPAVSVALEQAREAMGPFADQLTREMVVDSSRAAELLGWKPQAPGLVDDLTTGSYAT